MTTETNVQHTPDKRTISKTPWTYEQRATGRYDIVSPGTDGSFSLAFVAKDTDARLIAAAPTLLEALTKIANWSIADGSHAFGARLQDIARQAIALAKGEQDAN